LRLSSARRRVDAFLEQIDVLATSSFPHLDGKAALEKIRRHCLDRRKDLDLPADTRADLIDRLCLQLSDELADYTDILGFILRSTNVRNPFELHFVLKALIQKSLGQKADLLISSEWAYVPFTYPMSVDLLPDFVLIGTPAPESGNPLLTPLAGHEIGHSAWRVFGFPGRYARLVSDAVDAELGRNVKARKEIELQMPMGALQSARARDECAEHALKQLEEVFCDLFGLYLFGEAYVAAFDYLLGPGGYARALNYPSDAQRLRFLVAFAGSDALRLTIDPALTSHWIEGRPAQEDRPTAEIVDAVVSELVPAMRNELLGRLRASGVRSPDAAIVRSVLEAFERGEPYGERAELGEIVTAGWRRLRSLEEQPGLDTVERRKRHRVLGDLVLKSVEVAEYHDRIGHA
jgi:hypothetical protein